jgi:hypothetical protein
MRTEKVYIKHSRSETVSTDLRGKISSSWDDSEACICRNVASNNFSSRYCLPKDGNISHLQAWNEATGTRGGEYPRNEFTQFNYRT